MALFRSRQGKRNLHKCAELVTVLGKEHPNFVLNRQCANKIDVYEDGVGYCRKHLPSRIKAVEAEIERDTDIRRELAFRNIAHSVLARGSGHADINRFHAAVDEFFAIDEDNLEEFEIE